MPGGTPGMGIDKTGGFFPYSDRPAILLQESANPYPPNASPSTLKTTGLINLAAPAAVIPIATTEESNRQEMFLVNAAL
jgi:hypothetical protein